MHKMLSESESVALNNGTRMPLVLLGTFKIRGEETVLSVLDAALGAGYRGIDTATCYRNEADIGKALDEHLYAKHNLKREDIFITSKLAPSQQGYEKALEACRNTVKALRTSYVDLMLIHWPGTQGRSPDDAGNAARRSESWRALEDAQKQGLVRAIGVSNFMKSHLEELIASGKSVPSVLQIEHHPMLNQRDLVDCCKEHGIHYQAYSSLGTTAHHQLLCGHALVTEVAKQHGRTPAQVLLRWAVQQGISVLPKSTNPEHIRENIEVFDWSLDDLSMRRLSTELDSGRHFCWDPNSVK